MPGQTEKALEKELKRLDRELNRELARHNRRQDRLVFKEQSKINRMIRMDYAFVSTVNRQAIFERDNHTCMLCGRLLNMSVSAPHAMAATIDHIIPISKGGTHEPANVQSAHFICNSQKGNGTFSMNNIKHYFKK